MNAHGQSQVVEQVILFGVGISVAFGFLSAFESFGRDVKQDALDQQLRLQADLMSSHIAQLIQTGADGSVTVSLPEELAAESYRINLTDDGVAVRGGESIYLSRNLNGLEERYNLSGFVSSDRGQAIINVDDQTVTLGGS